MDNNAKNTPNAKTDLWVFLNASLLLAGAVIGVGLFTVGSQIVGLMGGTVIVASLISFVLILYPCAIIR